MRPCIQSSAPFKNKTIQAGCWWLTPVILATWEAKIRRITVQGQPRQIIYETLYPK
jgi:hypothetical protein